ncbi:hypothetical protein B0T22DRAFT_3943 [Podospora appendiculata]|uniref:D-xylose 1-dehydrogenase (NADP(+), D-xylono-1,5-lactone-forming) n=1 Tax=Podospora appendiculata TaxID=314037 RepID=A0AAE0XEX9_9PEZI|nr:hypothetical protein B0T22DRAFT_3943 [Podospora appendiculata]
MAFLTPAKHHPEVIVQAVAARDKKKATDFAKKHGIPQAYGSYDELLDDPSIDAVYIPLPNGLHFEWAVKALAKGKHVLVEKPAVSNATEAELLFRSPHLQGPNARFVLEAFHYRFQPSWLYFMSLLDQPNIAHVKVVMNIAAAMIPEDDIRFRYDLAGGAMMDLTYTMSVLRAVYGAEPAECTACEVTTMPPPNDRCDYKYRGTWRFPNGGTGEMVGSLQSSIREFLSPVMPAIVTHKPVVVADPALPPGQEKLRTRTVTLHNFAVGALWHRIDVVDAFEIRQAATAVVVKKWTTTEYKKAYTLREAGIDLPSETYWLSYKYQLDAFVDRIRGRNGTGTWVEPEDSIGQARMIDMAYAKSGLPLRPTSKFAAA